MLQGVPSESITGLKKIVTMPRRRSSRLTRGNQRKNQIVFHKGHRLTVPNHPTEYCSQPWFSLVLRILNPTTGITIGEIYNAFTSQLTGISFTASILNVRLFSIRVWGPIPTTNTPLRMTVRDIFDDVVVSTSTTGVGNLEIIENFADQVNRARVGYEYSAAQQQKSLFVIAAATDQVVALAGAGAGSVAYIRLLWRPYSPAPGLSTLSTANDIDQLSDRSAKLVIK